MFNVNETHKFTAEELALSIVKTAYHASHEMGLGFLQRTNSLPPDATLKNLFEKFKDGIRINVDYLFGRMVKINIHITQNKVEIFPVLPRADYQSWCIKYPTTEDLLLHSIENLEKEKGI